MTILGIGVDLVHIPRIAALLNRALSGRLASRILSPEEATEYDTLPAYDTTKRVRFLAVRWGVKEAAYKAMYPTVRPTWKELTYRGLCKGTKPSLVYHPSDTENGNKVGRSHTSVSHDGEYVYASVVVEVPIAHRRS